MKIIYDKVKCAWMRAQNQEIKLERKNFPKFSLEANENE